MNEVVKMERPEPLPAAITPMEMIDRAIQGGAGVETLEKLLALQERWEANQGRKAFDLAMAAAKAEIPTISKNRKVDFTTAKGRTNYEYEDMAGIAAVIDPILSRHGLSYRFRTAQEGASVSVTCIISHRDGYSEETTLTTAKDDSGNKNHIQAVGSVVTYLQRYTIKAALGLAAAKDDDGAKAGRAAPPSPISEEDFLTLKRRIEDQGEDADKVESFILNKYQVDALHDLDRDQMQAALVMIRKREQAKVA